MRKLFILFILIVTVPAFAQEEISEARQKAKQKRWDAFAEYIRNDVREYDAIAKAVDERDCETFLKLEKMTLDHIKAKRPLLAAELTERGICFEQNFEAAAQYLIVKYEKSPTNYYLLAKLGNIYWHGLGVEKDRNKATKYFKLSALYLGTKVLDPPKYEERIPTVKSYWGFTNKEKDWTYSTYEFGSWQLPPPLIEEINWLKGIKDAPNTGELVWNISQDLRYGTNGMPRHAERAHAWVFEAATGLNYAPIQIEAAKLMIEPIFRAEREDQFPDLPYDKLDIMSFHLILYQAIQNRNLIAYKYAYCNTQHQSEERKNYTTLFLVGVFLRNNGIQIDEEKFANIRSKVDLDIQSYAQEWIKDGIAKRIGGDLLGGKKKYCNIE